MHPDPPSVQGVLLFVTGTSQMCDGHCLCDFALGNLYLSAPSEFSPSFFFPPVSVAHVMSRSVQIFTKLNKILYLRPLVS